MNNINQPLISVVIPYYNPPFDYFKEAIESVLSQSYTNWELVIVDDGSAISSKQLLENHVNSLNDKRISIISLAKNHGVSIARNVGIESSKGDIITFLDSDDLYLPGHCNAIVNYFLASPECSVLFTPHFKYIQLGQIKKIFDNNSLTTIPLELDLNKKKKCILEMVKNAKQSLDPLLTARRNVFEKIKFDPDLNFGEDTDIDFRILSDDELLSKLAVCRMFGSLYRIYPSNNRLTHRLNFVFDNIEKLIVKYGEENSLAGEIVRYWISCNNYWRFSTLLSDYFNGGTIIKYLKETFSNSQPLKDKVNSVKTLTKAIYLYRFLMPLFGTDLRYAFFSTRNNVYNELKR